jgi:hypothetical protein
VTGGAFAGTIVPLTRRAKRAGKTFSLERAISLRAFHFSAKAVCAPGGGGTEADVTTTHETPGDLRDGDPLLARATTLGFRLTSYETDNGQIVWEWHHDDGGPCPQFITERVARYWMTEWIAQMRSDV